MTMRIPSRLLARSAVALALVVGAVASGSCVSERSTSASTDITGCVTPSAAAGLPVVFIRQFAFVPATVHVSAGQSVAWVNCEPDGTPHTATADDASFESGILHPNDAFIRPFPTAGTKAYHCELHPGMKATVIVD